MRKMTLAALLCSGCLADCDEPLDTQEDCGAEGPRQEDFQTVGAAPWDGVILDLEPDDCGRPTLDDAQAIELRQADGTAVDLALSDCGQRWLGVPEIPPGTWTELFLPGLDYGPEGTRDATLPLPEPLVIEPFGRDPSFSASALEGKAFLLDDQAGLECEGLGELARLALPGPAWLQITAVQEDRVGFRLVQVLEQGDLDGCVYLEDTATLSATGELLWQADHLTLATDPEIPAWDLALHLGFDGDAEEAAGAELSATLDLQHLTGRQVGGTDTAPLDWQDYCEITASLGKPCGPCPEGDLESCVHMRLFGSRATAGVLPIDTTDIPACQVALQTDIPSCNFGCASAPGRRVPLAVLALLGLALWRRRRPGA